jgi:hypothetical protein
MSTPKLTISGQSTFNAWWFRNKDQKFRNDETFGNAANPIGTDNADAQGYGRGYLFTMDDSSFKFDVSGKTDPGMDYGFVVVLNTDTQQTSYDKTIKENYIWMGGSWGRLTMGDTDGVEDIMAFGGSDVLGGTGGFDGNFKRVVNFVTGTIHDVDLVGDTEKATKVTYQTPRYYGFQGGISFTPQARHLGEGKINSNRDYGKNGERDAFDSRSIAGGLNFLNKWNNGFEWGLSGTAIFAQTHPETRGATWLIANQAGATVVSGSGNRKDTRAYAIGTVMRYAGFEFGFEFGDNGKSHEVKDLSAATGVKTNGGWFIDTGLAYNWGPTKLSVGYYYGKRKSAQLNADQTTFSKAKNRTNIMSASVDHKLAPGVGVYFEYAHYDMKNTGFNVDAMLHNSLNAGTPAAPASVTGPVGPKQKSDAFVLGTKVKF